MTKEIYDIKFCKSRNPIPTVELDLDSLPEGIYGYGDILFNALSKLAKKDETIKATVYVYQGNSVNFHKLTFSAFFGVCGNKKKVLDAISATLSALSGVRCRFSDYIQASHDLLQFHVEDGTAWRPLDAVTWFDGTEDNVNEQQNPSSASFIQSEFESSIEEAKKSNPSERKARLENAPRNPKQIFVTSTTYQRNPDVVAEVLKRAKGICEKCNSHAPFLRAKDNTPYLEVHHIVQLAHGGDDTVENSMALCPNCHRKAHFGINA